MEQEGQRARRDPDAKCQGAWRLQHGKLAVTKMNTFTVVQDITRMFTGTVSKHDTGSHSYLESRTPRSLSYLIFEYLFYGGSFSLTTWGKW